VYVGSTGTSPERRFAQHKRGYKANHYVEQYGLRLLPDLYEPYNPMLYRDAVEQETFLAEELRHQGFGVWQH
jgi:predicted GIY-YIG superfamily endonuclease